MKPQSFLKNLSSKWNESYFQKKSIYANGDSLALMKEIPDHSISLILTDPPYHSTKKANIVNDKAFATDNSFLDWMEAFSNEWKRILKFNGSCFVFCSSAMEAKLSVMFEKNFNVLSHIVWTKPNEPGYDGWKGKMKKEALRQWYPQSERIIFLEPSYGNTIGKTYFSQWLKDERTKLKISGHELTERIGAFGKVNHGGAVSNWETGRNVPSKEQFEKIAQIFKSNGVEVPEYGDIVRKFNVNAQIEYTDVWNFQSVKQYKGKHPAEKPINMLEHCIRATTEENDIVLDCFAGSGNTLLAASNLNRFSIGIDLDKKWYENFRDSHGQISLFA